MYYERTDAESPWTQNNKKSALFKKSTLPIEIVPLEFWNVNRKQSTPDPEYNSATHILSAPQELENGTVGRVAVELTDEEIAANLLGKRKMMIVTPWQFLKALNIKGIRAEVEDMVAQADQDTQDGFQRASSFERLDPLVVSFGYALEKSDEYLDELFELAGTL